jgi:hypothetical protein
MRRLLFVCLVLVVACKSKPKWADDNKGSGSAGSAGSGSSVASTGTDSKPVGPPIESTGKALTGATMLSVGGERACVYTDGKKLWCWTAGQPAEEVAVPGGAEIIGMAGAECAIIDTGDLWCFSPKEMKVPANVQSGGQIAAWADEVCTGHRMDIKCWKIGTPEPHAQWGWAGVDTIHLGDTHTVCSDISGGTIECSDITQEQIHNEPLRGPENIDELAMGGGASCATLENSHDVECWTDPKKVTKVAGVTGAKAVAVGPGFGCAIVGSGVTCWELGPSGPAGVANIGGVTNAKAVGVGNGFGCALAGDKPVCWGKASKDPGTAQAVSRK